MGHCAKMCRNKKTEVHEITQARSGCLDDNSFYFGSLETADKSEPPWRIDLEVNWANTNFNTDCGADVSIISNRVHKARQQLEVTTKVTEPSDFCSPVVLVPKFNHKIRICVDHNWRLMLDEDCSKLTTFITPSG